MSLTNASQPAKLKVGDKPKIQEGLEFISSVSVMENKYHIVLPKHMADIKQNIQTIIW